jgi:hypothetical protein
MTDAEPDMRIEVSWSTVSFGMILLCLAAVAAVTYYFLESRRIAAAENRQRRQFEREMASVRLPEWNGDTYDWSPESLAYLNDTHLYAGPGVADTTSFEALPDGPVPPSTVSGPLPVMDSGDFIARLRAENSAFLEGLEDYAQA